MKNRQRKSELAVDLGLGVNIILAGAKISVGLLGRSPALFADGINSLTDVSYYIVVKILTRLADKPPDREHPYGHRQLETIAAVVTGAFVMLTGIAIFWDSAVKTYEIIHETRPMIATWRSALWVALATVLVKIALTVWTRRVGRQVANPAIMALAADHRNDVAAAAAAAAGILMARFGHTWFDPAAGAIVALFVLRTGIEILRESTLDLMSTTPGEAMAKWIEQTALDIPQVVVAEEISSQRIGPYLVLNLTVGVDGEISIAEGDRVASLLERRLIEGNGLIRRVHIHVHPAIRDSIQPLDGVRHSV